MNAKSPGQYLAQILATISLTLIVIGARAETITVLYTNDIESVYEPVESFWRDDIKRMGGMAHLSGLINSIRSTEPNTLLVDAGDMFTGSLSKATQGRLVFDLYSTMGYDAVNLGNHEFEYGWPILRHVMQRADFPVLNANIYYDNTSINIARQYTIKRVGNIRVGIIGIMGVDAFINTMMKSNREGLYVKPATEILQPLIDIVSDESDLIILLTHQNRTAPMQTNKESDPEVQRGFDEDYALAGALTGVDLIVGGHSDNGLETPVRHPDTGTYIVMTYGQGMHLGYARFSVKDEPTLETGRLIPVDADRYAENLEINHLIADARAAHPGLTRSVGFLDAQAHRQYYRESPIGNLLADLLRDHANADVGLVAAGAIRADFGAGDVTVEDVLNVFPFTDTVSVLTITGEALQKVIEKGLSLEYGLAQFSGIQITYDGRRPAGQRLLTARVNGEALELQKNYTLVTGSFTATGGENYTMFEGADHQRSDLLVSDAFIQQLQNRELTPVPALGRLIDIAREPLPAAVKSH